MSSIKELGEFGLIEHLNKKVKHYQANTRQGIGDDAAVLDYGSECCLVSADLLVENIHFDLVFHPLKYLGYKAVSVNVSDIAAMNGIPQQILVNLALSSRFTLEAVDELYAGMHQACEDYHVDLVGGDTTSSRTGLMISITALGKATPDLISYRSGAGESDVLCVTGDLGAAYLGLLLLQREKKLFLEDENLKPEFSGQSYPLRRYLRPQARTDVIHTLRTHKVKPTAMIDISDGLSSEILHLCKASQLGAKIYEQKLPIDRDAHDLALNTFNLQPATCILNGGDDYELLFTLKFKDYEKVKHLPEVLALGYMTKAAEGKKLITNDGQAFDLKAQGWQHF